MGAHETLMPSAASVWREPDSSPLWDVFRAGTVLMHHVGACGTDARPVTVTWANLACTPAGDARVLSAAERARARDIDDAGGRARFVAGRTFVRRALGACIDGKPYCGEFVVGRFGKPRLPPPHASLGFNVSHAGDLIIAAIRPGGEIGVDIERRDRAIPPRLADVVFNHDEQDCLSRCDDWRSAFLLGWTCKEAVLKCIGCGLLRDPKRIKVFIDNDGVRNSIAQAYSERGEPIGTYRITLLPWSGEMLGVMAVSCA
ncbi:4'-phosphopantetheinyl transferase family protein [Burkholderia cepacia]|uniref:4'-phosphopantetheinyl transferase family protein n=1 Tax=Burkholderia cepacia TaxID=292 RepID=UPI002ABE03DD|nr:4'-phosphopantetheinyl transferase superfamily protein [Burkholderia cepacia]